MRCSTCFNQLCEDCKELDHHEHGDPAATGDSACDGDQDADDDEDDDGDYNGDNDHDDAEHGGGTGFEYFYCKVCQFRSCQGKKHRRVAIMVHI